MNRAIIAQVAIVLAVLALVLLIVSCAQRPADIDDPTGAAIAKTVQDQQK